MRQNSTKGVFQMTASGVKASEKNTNDLMEELNDSKVPIENYIQSNSDSFINIDLSKFWKELINKSGMIKTDIINKSDFSYVYFYDVINGRKIPSRDKIIRLALALGLSLDECQTALKFCGRSQLYPRQYYNPRHQPKTQHIRGFGQASIIGRRRFKITFFKGRGKNGKKMSVLSERNA